MELLHLLQIVDCISPAFTVLERALCEARAAAATLRTRARAADLSQRRERGWGDRKDGIHAAGADARRPRGGGAAGAGHSERLQDGGGDAQGAAAAESQGEPHARRDGEQVEEAGAPPTRRAGDARRRRPQIVAPTNPTSCPIYVLLTLIAQNSRHPRHQKKNPKNLDDLASLLRLSSADASAFTWFLPSPRLDDRLSIANRQRSVYEDADGVRKEEIAALGGGQNVFSTFYDRLKEVRDFHKSYPGFHAPGADEFLAPFKADLPLEFSGEEANGRYLDLHALHHAFQNGAFGRQLDYLVYLSEIADFASVPRDKKFSKAYAEYLTALLEYLQSFHRRVKPVVFLETVMTKAEEEFDEQWRAGVVPGWEDKGVAATSSPGGEGALDLEAFGSPAELQAVGAEAVKRALGALGLKQGGTDEQRLERLWATRGLAPEQFDRRLFAKGRAPVKDAREAARREEAARGVARLEGLVERLLEHLGSVLDATKGNVEKKATLSLAELEAEAEEDDDFVEEEDEDEEEEVYNPLKLPLGWDGKPIPYWLYKLHGLNLEFTCEICGNYSYWGRRAFERHFKEYRHQHGMRCLKIPNTKAFAEVRARLFPPFSSLFTLRAPLAPRSTPTTPSVGMMRHCTGHGFIR